jgi:hypothetical protein
MVPYSPLTAGLGDLSAFLERQEAVCPYVPNKLECQCLNWSIVTRAHVPRQVAERRHEWQELQTERRLDRQRAEARRVNSDTCPRPHGTWGVDALRGRSVFDTRRSHPCSPRQAYDAAGQLAAVVERLHGERAAAPAPAVGLGRIVALC